MPACERCNYAGDADTFEPCLSPYHDLRCPKCGTTAIDTSDIDDPDYGYGEGNVLRSLEGDD